ncbi:MAG: hypothetical protein H6719_26655 [Sandaracinaceae bacterium]|nr:hypothetical protein [Sandaracinaceae bacterium]
MQKRAEVRRARLRLLRIAGTPGGAWDPPLLSLSPQNLRRVDADGRAVVPLTGAREELWYRGEGARFRVTLDEVGKLVVNVERAGAEPAVIDRLLRIPTARPPTDPYFGRWEYAKQRAVLTPKGAGLILHPDSVSIDQAPDRVHVYEGEGILLALRDVPHGARVVCADGVPGLEVDGLVSDVKVPDLEAGPEVEIDANEAFLRGFTPVGVRASFGGLDFAAFATSQGDGSPDLARFTRKPHGVDHGALRTIERPDDEDALLGASLAAELAPAPTLGRVRTGKPGTITLTDGRRYRVHVGVREQLPKGTIELVTHALLDGVVLARICTSHDDLTPPDANVVLAKLQAFLLGLHAVLELPEAAT